MTRSGELGRLGDQVEQWLRNRTEHRLCATPGCCEPADQDADHCMPHAWARLLVDDLAAYAEALDHVQLTPALTEPAAADKIAGAVDRHGAVAVDRTLRAAPPTDVHSPVGWIIYRLRQIGSQQHVPCKRRGCVWLVPPWVSWCPDHRANPIYCGRPTDDGTPCRNRIAHSSQACRHHDPDTPRLGDS